MWVVTNNILDELQWRGLIAQSTDLDALRAHLDEGAVSGHREICVGVRRAVFGVIEVQDRRPLV